MYGENTKTIAIPIYRILPYPVIHSIYIPPSSLYIVYMCILCISDSKEVILRNPEGLRNVTECIHEKACRRHALTSLYPGYEIITR